MAKSPDYAQIVANAARRTNVSITKDDLLKIKWCREGTALAQWIEQNLTSDRLLSSEELFFSKKDADGQSKLSSEVSTGNIPLHEDELFADIADLNASTAALNRQSQVLKTQQALVNSRHDEGAGWKRRGQIFIEQIEQRELADLQKLKADIRGAQDEVEALLRNTKGDIDKTAKKISALMSEVLKSNDRTLADLETQDLAGAVTDQTTSISLAAVERLKGILSGTIAEEIQTRLDRVYLESLHEDIGPVNGDHENTSDDAKGLEEDLNSLYTDIPDVAEMYVSQTYGDPLVRAIREEETHRAAVVSQHAYRITDRLSEMTTDLDYLAERLRAFHSYCCAVQKLQASYNQSGASTHIITSSPNKLRQGPPRTVGPAMEVLLRHFSLPTIPTAEIHTLMNSKVARLREHQQSSNETIAIDSKKTLDTRRKAVETFMQSVDQSDSETSRSLDALEAKVTSVKEGVEAVTAADANQNLRKQRGFIERWS